MLQDSGAVFMMIDFKTGSPLTPRSLFISPGKPGVKFNPPIKYLSVLFPGRVLAHHIPPRGRNINFAYSHRRDQGRQERNCLFQVTAPSTSWRAIYSGTAAPLRARAD